MAHAPTARELNEDVREAAKAYVTAAKDKKLPTPTVRAVSYRGVAAKHNMTVRDFTELVDAEALKLALQRGIKL